VCCICWQPSRPALIFIRTFVAGEGSVSAFSSKQLPPSLNSCRWCFHYPHSLFFSFLLLEVLALQFSHVFSFPHSLGSPPRCKRGGAAHAGWGPLTRRHAPPPLSAPARPPSGASFRTGCLQNGRCCLCSRAVCACPPRRRIDIMCCCAPLCRNQRDGAEETPEVVVAPFDINKCVNLYIRLVAGTHCAGAHSQCTA